VPALEQAPTEPEPESEPETESESDSEWEPYQTAQKRKVVSNTWPKAVVQIFGTAPKKRK